MQQTLYSFFPHNAYPSRLFFCYNERTIKDTVKEDFSAMFGNGINNTEVLCEVHSIQRGI